MAYGLTKAWRKWSKLEDLRNGKSSLCLQKTKVTKNPCFEQKFLHTSTPRESTTMKMSTDWLTDRLFGLLGQMIYVILKMQIGLDLTNFYTTACKILYKMTSFSRCCCYISWVSPVTFLPVQWLNNIQGGSWSVKSFDSDSIHIQEVKGSSVLKL